MNILIVYDSVFGNTEAVAEAIGKALQRAGNVRTLRAGAVTIPALEGVDLLLIGSPTRAFRPTPIVTRLFHELPAGRLEGVRAAAFDTRIDPSTIRSPILRLVVRSGGYAAPRIARWLERAGALRAADPAGFIVEDSQGPLRSGEKERAAQWARRLADPEASV